MSSFRLIKSWIGNAARQILFESPIGYFYTTAQAGAKPPHTVVGDAAIHTAGPFKIIPVPYFEDNYGYLVVDTEKEEAAIIDPADPAAIMQALRVYAPTASVAAFLTTHKHWDHSGGNAALKQTFPSAKFYGSHVDFTQGPVSYNSFYCIDSPLHGGDRFKVGRMAFTALSTPYHTKGSLVYLFDPALSNPAANMPASVFTGDTLFVGGVGRFFEGTGVDMARIQSLLRAELNPSTLVWPGHEYTHSNLVFAHWINPSSESVKSKLESANNCKASNTPTIPSTVAEEFSHNPFLVVSGSTADSWEIQARIQSTVSHQDREAVESECRQQLQAEGGGDSEELLARAILTGCLRRLKDQFKPPVSSAGLDPKL
ncbi:beta-lactamase-like protein [Polychytrium aggregatum]|uniref:beta-lactamase-like protein n=1 Tax=Polychytrium aggregatum TaxID=110093 RepID=UPI0022FEF26E|nr:beta-lactamase-like protein [Polychytrium aggregatum]KAI9206101.1 beta-lactamase-like protein [Polychytrium aggregatum]